MFTIRITEPAESDLLSTIQYITDVLKAPDSAKKLFNQIEEKLKLLKEMPLYHSLGHDNYLSTKGIRSFLVGNYYIFYIVKESENAVSIVRILYSRRDWAFLLKKADTEEIAD